MPSLVVRPACLALLLCIVICPTVRQTEHDTTQLRPPAVHANGLALEADG